MKRVRSLIGRENKGPLGDSKTGLADVSASTWAFPPASKAEDANKSGSQSVLSLPPGEVFDTRGAAKYLHISPGLLVLYRERGGGPSYVKLARLVRYRRTSLDAWLVSKERSNTSTVLGEEVCNA